LVFRSTRGLKLTEENGSKIGNSPRNSNGKLALSKQFSLRRYETLKTQMSEDQDVIGRRIKNLAIPAEIKRQIQQITNQNLHEKFDERKPSRASRGLKYTNLQG
jgi:hypothetical protein